MKNLITTIGIAGVMITSTLTINTNPAASQTPSPDKVTFFCIKVHDDASGAKIPATVVWIPETKENRRLIGWKSDYFGKDMTPEKRCQIVTKKFQDKYDSGNLNYINVGKAKGFPILCGLKNPDDSCDGNSQLFTLKKYNDPQRVRTALSNIVSGKSSEMLLQSSGNSAVPFKDFLKSLPVVKK